MLDVLELCLDQYPSGKTQVIQLFKPSSLAVRLFPEATCDYVEHEDYEQYTGDIEAAHDGHAAAVQNVKRAYEAAEANALAARLGAEANANAGYAVSQALATKTRQQSDAAALRDYEVADSMAYVALTADLALLDKTYWLFEASTLESSAAALASSSPSPWASYLASQQAANADWVEDAAVAQHNKRVADARGQAGVDSNDNPTGGGEIGIANAERDSQIAAANADYTRSFALAGAAHAAATAQAAALAALGGSGKYQATYPTLSDLTDLPSYAIEPANDLSYYVYHEGWGYWGWNHHGLGLGGYYGSGFFGGFYGGYGLFGYDPFGGLDYYGAYNYGDPLSSGWWLHEVQEPAELNLAAGFWSLDEQVAVAEFSEGAAPDLIHPTLTSPRLLIDPDSGDGFYDWPLVERTDDGPTMFDDAEVLDVLQAADPELAEFWEARGDVLPMPVASRPDNPPPAPPDGTTKSAAAPSFFDAKGLQKVWLVLPTKTTAERAALYIFEQLRHGSGVVQSSPMMQHVAAEFAKFQESRRTTFVSFETAEEEGAGEESENPPNERKQTTAERRAELKEFIHDKLTNGFSKEDLDNFNFGLNQAITDWVMDYVALIKEAFGIVLDVAVLSQGTWGAASSLGGAADLALDAGQLIGVVPNLRPLKKQAEERMAGRVAALRDAVDHIPNAEQIKLVTATSARIIADAVEVYVAFSKTSLFQDFFNTGMLLATSRVSGPNVEADLGLIVDVMAAQETRNGPDQLSLLKMSVLAVRSGPMAGGYVTGIGVTTILEELFPALLTGGFGAVVGAAVFVSKHNRMLLRAVNFLEEVADARSFRYFADLAESIAPKGWISRLKFIEYLDEIGDIAKKSKIGRSQYELAVEAIDSGLYKYLGKEKAALRHAEFKSKKNALIKEWEEHTDRKWPTYKDDVPAKKGGEPSRKKDSYYDAHEIIPNSYGGPHEWWNITPARFPSEHQGGIHGKGRLFKLLFPLD
jgi:hypothetical protein